MTSSPTQYRADVDGIRALAILPVLLFHADFRIFSGGFVGVDIFFVISGYVIASKIRSGIDAGQFSLLDFYSSRVRRLFPAMAVTLVAVYATALVLFLPPAMEDVSRSMIATVLFSANVYFWKFSGYFDIGAQSRPLLHMWSLAVEEQFYFIIPVMLLVVLTRVRKWALFAVVAGSTASLGLSISLASVAPTANFFLLPTRAWELGAGVALALLPAARRLGRRAREGLSLVGLLLMLGPVFLYDESTSFPGLSALPPVLGTALLIYAGGHGPGTIRAMLSYRLVVGIGLISYSLYLVHWPVTVFTRSLLLRNPTTAESVAIVLASIGLAILCWRYVETPFRRGRSVCARRVFGTAGVALASVAALAGLGLASHGFPARMPDFTPRRAASGGGDVWMGNRCFLQNQPAAAWAGRDCVRTTGAPRNALLWGDSFAAHYLVGLIDNAAALTHNIVQYTYAGCPPILGYRSYARPGCEEFNSRVFEVVRQFDIETVVIAARWDQACRRGHSGLSHTVEALRKAGVTVYVIGQSPVFAFDTETLRYRNAGVLGAGHAAWYPSLERHLNDHLRSVIGGGNFIDPLPSFCDGELCDYIRAGDVLFYDYGHLSGAGSDFAVRSYFPLLARRSAGTVRQ